MKKYVKIFLFIIIIALLPFLLNNILNSVVSKKINKLVLSKEFKQHTAQVKEIKFNLFKRSLVAKNIVFTPTNEAMLELKAAKLPKSSLKKITISSIEINNISLLKALFSKEVEINEILITDCQLQNFKNPNSPKEKKASKKINLDSLHIAKIKGVEIDKLKIQNFQYQEIDVTSDKILIELKPVDFSVESLALEKIKSELFKLMPIKNNIEIKDVEISIPKNGYKLDAGAINVNFAESLIDVKNFKYKPLISVDSLSQAYQYNSEVFDVDIKRKIIYNFQLKKMLKNEGLFIDSIRISGLDLQVYKNKQKPYNKQRRPSIPHLTLKKMESPLFIQNIKIDSSRISYQEHLGKKMHYRTMKLAWDDAKIQINNITSIKKYRENPLEVQFKSKFMNKAHFNMNMKLPLKDQHDAFYFNGTIGALDFSALNPVLYSYLGIETTKGRIDGIKFDATAHPDKSKGKITMRYHDLRVKIPKHHSKSKNKFLSWIVKEVTHTSNPRHSRHKKHKATEIYLHAEREVYKGFLVYVWKTIRSGVIGTISPTGISMKKEKRKKKRKVKRHH